MSEISKGMLALRRSNNKAERIVGMMGPEPFIRALDSGAQVVLAGRSSDPASFAATIMRRWGHLF